MKQRRRSRVVIGPGGALYLVATGSILAAAVYTQANLLFWGLGLTLGGGLVSLLLSWRVLGNVRVQRLLPGHAVSGEPCVVRYHITNRSWLPAFSVLITENWGRGSGGWKRSGPVADSPPRLPGRPWGWILHIGPHQSVQAEATCWPVSRGMLRFERVVLSSSFPFGIVRKVVEFEQVGEVLVYPRLHRLSRRTLATLSTADVSGRRHVDRAGGNEEFFGLREYRYGDSLKLVDWKHTARTGKLVARELTLPSPPRIMVLLDLSQTALTRRRLESELSQQEQQAKPHWWQKPAGPGEAQQALEALSQAEERAVSLAASVLADAYFHGYQIGLAVAGARCRTFPVHHSLPHRVRILESLAGLDCSQAPRDDAALVVQPSVVVHPGHGEQVVHDGPGPRVVLGASDMERYVLDGHTATPLLTREAGPVSRRVELEERAREKEAMHAR